MKFLSWLSPQLRSPNEGRVDSRISFQAIQIKASYLTCLNSPITNRITKILKYSMVDYVDPNSTLSKILL
jgi:hypothetical protein